MRWLLPAVVLLAGCKVDESTSVNELVDQESVNEAPVNEEPVVDTTVGCDAIAASCLELQQGCVGATDTAEARCALCPTGTYPEGDLAQCAELPGTPMEKTFEPMAIAAGEEIPSICQSWFLNNPEEIWVNTVEFENAGYYHHSNWFSVPQGKMNYASQDETWVDCYGEGFDEIGAALQGGVVFAQSTQIPREVQRFPQGAAIRIPPYSRIIGAIHLLNATASPAETHHTMILRTLKPEEVKVKLTPFRLTYGALSIPPKSDSYFASECDLTAEYDKWAKKPLDLKLYYALPHFHDLGTSFHLEIMGGPRDGEVIFDQGGYGSDPYGRVFSDPIDLTGATGLRFGCGYYNPREEAVGWGVGDQEMCVMLGFAESEMAFAALVESNEVQDDPVLGGDETVMNSGPCSVVGFPFAQDKLGGDPLP